MDRVRGSIIRLRRKEASHLCLLANIHSFKGTYIKCACRAVEEIATIERVAEYQCSVRAFLGLLVATQGNDR